MARQPTDAVVLLLTNQNLDLNRQITDLRRELESMRKENETLYKVLERPAVATMNEQQVDIISNFLYDAIMGIAITRKEEKPS